MFTKMVQEFTKACESNLPQKPTLLTKEKVEFITQMVQDELEELAQAETIVDQADAFIDMIYYICDTAVRHGINLDPLFSIVHRANMQKVVDGKVIRREDGKILKPKGWIAPEPLLEKEMKSQEENGSFS